MKDRDFISVCPKCQKAHVQLIPSEELDFLKECEEIVDTLIFVAECEDCKE